MATLGIIPARGGSKRIPGKNIIDLAGEPLIGWTIRAALAADSLDEVIVSSDDDEILEVSRSYGVRTITRPEAISGDRATNFETAEHIHASLEDDFDHTAWLQPTSPLRNHQHIDAAFDQLKKREAHAIISVCETEHSPLWSNTLPPDLSMQDFIAADIKATRSQDLPTYYRLNGAIYICRTDRLLEQGTFFISDRIYAYIMDPEQSVDIDTEIDLKLAELYLSKKAD